MLPEQHEECTWGGFYIGGNIGGAFDSMDVHTNLIGGWEGFPEDRGTAERLANHDLEADGFVAGGFIGYNFQFGHFVVGLEADGDHVGLRDSFNSGRVMSPLGDIINVRHSVETNYRLTFGPRVGVTFGRVLFYATGGLAVSDFDFKQIVRDTKFRTTQEGSTDDGQVGWTGGGGLQICLTHHWSARVEYRYTDLDCEDFSTEGPTPFFTGPTFAGHHEACVSYHSVTAGIAFGF